MSRNLTFTLYGHFTNHKSFMSSCLLWMWIKGTKQKGHSPLLPLVQDAVEAPLIRLHLSATLPLAPLAQPPSITPSAKLGFIIEKGNGDETEIEKDREREWVHRWPDCNGEVLTVGHSSLSRGKKIYTKWQTNFPTTGSNRRPQASQAHYLTNALYVCEFNRETQKLFLSINELHINYKTCLLHIHRIPSHSPYPFTQIHLTTTTALVLAT